MINRDINFAQYLINEIIIDYSEGQSLTEKVYVKYDDESKRFIHYGSGEITLWDLLKKELLVVHPDKSNESLELECLKTLTNLSVTELASLCEISKQAISQMINGQRKPSQKVLDKIKKHLNIQ